MVVHLPKHINRRYASVGGIVLILLWLWLALRPYRASSSVPWNPYSDTRVHLPPVTDVFDFAPIESESIKSICDEAQWRSEVVFRCDESVGGIGNIRNSILNCVRYAISGGGGLVVPTFVLRNASDISHIRTGMTTSMDYFFDTQHFVDSLRLSCPSLPVYNSNADIPQFQENEEAVSLLPESLVKNIPRTGLPNPEQWRGLFDTWLEQYKSPNRTGPIIVKLGRSYLQYPIYSDGEGFALSFGGLLKLRADTRRLATHTLLRMAEKFSLDVDLSQPFLKNAFFGAHLRTEKDAKEGWPTIDWVYSRFETQSKKYLEQAPRSNSSVIYVASGDLNEVAKFAIDARVVNMTVITKIDLLEGESRAELEKLAWDQQALVDFLVMHKASDFAGIGHSSFAWNVALKRHTFAENKTHLDGPQMLSDDLSQIYGAVRGYPEYAACLWP